MKWPQPEGSVGRDYRIACVVSQWAGAILAVVFNSICVASALLQDSTVAIPS